MDLPAIWQTPVANAVIKNGARSFIDGDTINITYSFLRSASSIDYIKGNVPPGVNAEPTGIVGTMSPSNPLVPTPPKDYTLTVRAWTEATPSEIASGYPQTWYEDRTFTIVGGLWYGPPAGALTNTGNVAYQHGDAVSVQLAFDPNRLPGLALIGGTLPPGLIFSSSTRRISGTMGALPKGITEYPLLFRATISAAGQQQFQDRSFVFEVNPLDERHGWDTSWLDNEVAHITNPGNFVGTVYNLGTIYRGSNVEVQLRVNNPDNDPLVFVTTGANVQYQTWAPGLPYGLDIHPDGKITGTPNIANNEPGYYFFRVYARDPQGTEGQPRTSELVFCFFVDPDIRNEQQLNEEVKWITPAGSIGSTYETFASHFSVDAVPQFNLTALNNEYQSIQYQLIGSSPFPTGVVLEPDTGNITGTMPHVDSDTTFTFTVRARVVFINRLTGTIRNSTAYADRQFSFTVLNLYYSDTVSNLYIAVPPFDRRLISEWVYGTLPEIKDNQSKLTPPDIMTILGRDTLFRKEDPSWGRVERPRILLIAGLLTPSPNVMMAALRDYHHKFKLLIGTLKWAKGVDPSGNYVYDAVYFSITDPMARAGGFNAFGGDETLPPPTKLAVPKFNLPVNSDRYFPVSIQNVRKDLINVANRQPWAQNPQMPETATSRGLGVPGKEGLPFWMTCQQIAGKSTSVLGYTPAIELAYMLPGHGAQAVKSLQQAGFEAALTGHPILVDRYLLISDGLKLTEFDVSLIDNSLTSFDGPDSDTPTQAVTTFDTSYTPTSKYYKFPPGDA
jgi:hypothetical protein